MKKTVLGNLVLISVAALTLASCGAGYHTANRGRYPEPPRRTVHVRPQRPGPGYVWVEAYRDWRGPRVGFVIVPGRWLRKPHPRAVWVPGHWTVRRGARVWVRAGWR